MNRLVWYSEISGQKIPPSGTEIDKIKIAEHQPLFIFNNFIIIEIKYKTAESFVKGTSVTLSLKLKQFWFCTKTRYQIPQRGICALSQLADSLVRQEKRFLWNLNPSADGQPRHFRKNGGRERVEEKSFFLLTNYLQQSKLSWRTSRSPDWLGSRSAS